MSNQTIIDEIIEKIGYIKRYSDTRYFDWNETKKELKTILEEHLNKLDTGKVVAKEESLCPNCGHSTITKAIQIPVEPYGQSLKSQLPLTSNNETEWEYCNRTCPDCGTKQKQKICTNCGYKIFNM